MYASWTSGFGWGGGTLTSLWTCSHHVCFVNFGVWGGGYLTSLWTCSRHVCFDMLRELRDCLGYIYILQLYSQYYTMKITFRYTYMYINMCIHIHLFSLLYTYKCTYFLVVIYAHKYISHLRKHITTCIFLYINILYIHIYLCLDNLN